MTKTFNEVGDFWFSSLYIINVIFINLDHNIVNYWFKLYNLLIYGYNLIIIWKFE